MGDLHRMYFVLMSRSGCSRSQPHLRTWFKSRKSETSGGITYLWGDNIPHSDSIPHDSLYPWIQLWLFHLSPETVKRRQADEHIYWRRITGANTGVLGVYRLNLTNQYNDPIHQNFCDRFTFPVIQKMGISHLLQLQFERDRVSQTQTHSPLNTGFSTQREGRGHSRKVNSNFGCFFAFANK